MKHVFSLALFFGIPFTLRAVDSPEFDRLRASYNAAIERATNPITKTYLVELEKQRDAYARATRLEAANVVQAEIDAIKQAGAAAQAAGTSATKEPVTSAASAAPPLHWFAGKTWLTDANTKWTFSRNGSGERVRGKDKIAIFTWKVLDNGILELAERLAPDKPVTTTYLQFKTKSEAWFGTSQDKLLARLHAE